LWASEDLKGFAGVLEIEDYGWAKEELFAMLVAGCADGLLLVHFEAGQAVLVF
jgi:hypothetical protein